MIELVRHIENRHDLSCSRKMKQPHVLNLYKMTEGHESNERKTKKRFRQIRISAKGVANVNQSYFGFRRVYVGFAA